MLEDPLTRRTQVKASLALEQKRVIALRGALAETEGSDSGHSGGESESTSGDSSLEQVVPTIPGLGYWLISMLVFICFNFSSFAHSCKSSPGELDPESSSPPLQRSRLPFGRGLTIHALVS